MNLVFIYGPPGVGKLTTAKELARLTGYKLFDNHASIDVIRRVFDFGDEPFWPMVYRLRFDVIEQAARHGVSIVFTGVYVHSEDIEYVATIEGLVQKHGGHVCFVALRCQPDSLDERMQTEQRASMGKLTSLAVAKEAQAGRDIFALVPGRDSLSLDNTNVAPTDAARHIIAHYDLPLAPASAEPAL